MESGRWADDIDDDAYLQPSTIIEKNSIPIETPQDKDGQKIITVCENTRDPDTNKPIKVTRTFKIEKRLVSKGVSNRKKWSKFGNSANDPSGPISATTVVSDEIKMQFLSTAKETGDFQEQADNFMAKLQLQDGKTGLRCRFCQDNHFSAKCPYKDSGIPMSELNINATVEKKDPSENKSYVIPAMRSGGNRRGDAMGLSSRVKEESTIRLSNLPEIMTETDLVDLCQRCGKIERTYLAKDKTTGMCKGFAFVTYQTRDVARHALNILHGHGYDHLILNAEWSKSGRD